MNDIFFTKSFSFFSYRKFLNNNSRASQGQPSAMKFSLFQAEKKRVKQELSTAQTLTAGILRQAALLRNDESILVHIRGRDCVAVEARYHKRCYQTYTKCLTRKTNSTTIKLQRCTTRRSTHFLKGLSAVSMP